MSECQIKRNFCMTHKCWVAVWDDPRCPMSELAAEVERLTNALADHDQKIEAALALHWPQHDAFDDRYIDCGVCNWPAPCPTVQALRGEA